MLIKRILLFCMSLLFLFDPLMIPLEANNNTPPRRQVVQKKQPQKAIARRHVGQQTTHLSAQTLRNSSGVAKISRSLHKPKRMMRGSRGNAGLVPHEVAMKLQGRSFTSFRDFRKNFWIAVSQTDYAKQFSGSNRALMAKGKAPHVVLQQRTDGHHTYELHHITPINRGGQVFDMSNIAIVTPRFHAEVLEKRYHYGN